MDIGTVANAAQIVQTIPVLLAFAVWSGIMRSRTKASVADGGTSQDQASFPVKTSPLFIIALLAVILSAGVSAASLAERLGWFHQEKIEQVFDKNFNNQMVPLDNHESRM
jgi:hypothetical protein